MRSFLTGLKRFLKFSTNVCADLKNLVCRNHKRQCQHLVKRNSHLKRSYQLLASLIEM